jgi:long-chain acyl-CoA synthetase
MHTGDLATVDEEHYIYILDRAKDMIISGGENVYSLEVENALYTHPAVLEVAVFGIPRDKWGEAVHAIVVCKPGSQVSVASFSVRTGVSIMACSSAHSLI